MADHRIVPCSKCAALNRLPLAVPETAAPKCGNCKEELESKKFVFDATARLLKQAIASSPVPVVIDCWASWCGPCKAFGPVFEHHARNHPQNALYLKLNTEQEEMAAAELGIRSIPTILLFEAGKEKARQSGALSSPAFQQWLLQHGVASN